MIVSKYQQPVPTAKAVFASDSRETSHALDKLFEIVVIRIFTLISSFYRDHKANSNGTLKHQIWCDIIYNKTLKVTPSHQIWYNHTKY